jgi:HlyD family secretion protein
MQGFFKKYGRTIIVLLVIGLAVGGWLYFRGNANESATAYQTVEVKQGNLTATIGATGTVRAKQTAILSWQTNGAAGTVNVKVGDNVPDGFVMALIEKTSLPQSLILAEADLVNAQKALDNLLNSDTALAQAAQNLVTAKQALEEAEKDLVRLKYPRASQDQLDRAQAEIDLANQQVSRAEDAFKFVKDRSDGDPVKSQAELNLINARLERDKKEATLEWYLGKPSELDAAKYQATYDLAKAQLDDAQREFERLSGGNLADIQAAQARVDAAQATLNLARIIAPFGGIVTEAYPLPGDQVAPGTKAFRLDDLSSLFVDVEVSEVDINNIVIGQPVAVSFDAILGREYDGEVVEVAKVGTVAGGVVNFKVTVQLINHDDLVKPGMTAAVDITIKELLNATLIPNRAVRLIEGVRYVYVLVDGQPVQKRIQILSSADQQSAIAEGEVKVGDTVILNPPTEFGPGRPGGGFGN